MVNRHKTGSRVWHPNTQMREWEEFDEIIRGDGMYLVDGDGRRMLDGVASMWCNVWGHSRPEIISAISEQARLIQHSPLFNLTNTPAKELAGMLVQISPGMERVFFSDNGSTAMESAFKIAMQYWSNRGVKRWKLASLENGYHGDTFGAMSVGYVDEFFSKFKSGLFETCRFKTPRAGGTPDDDVGMILDSIREAFSRDDSIAAFIMESGAQVAGGVNIYPEGFQHDVSRLCKEYDVLFILDEVATGFGRLGSMAEYATQESEPDIVAFGKMLTGGCLPMAATLVTEKIYNAFLGDFNEKKHLFHGHTFTGNPIAAAVACKNIKMYEECALIEKIHRSAKVFERYRDEICGLGAVADVRYKGMLMGIELKARVVKKMRGSVNKTVFEAGRDNGIYLRTLGRVIMLVPPLAMPDEQIESLIRATIRTIRSACDG